MKKLSFLFLALILLLTGCSKKSTFTLKGNISSLSSDTILVFYQEPNYKLDTIIAQNGKFSYTINSDTFTIFSLLLSDKEVLPVFANKGESVTWNGTPGDIQRKRRQRKNGIYPSSHQKNKSRQPYVYGRPSH